MLENGIYSTLLNILSILTISQMGVFNISAPIINKSIEENNFQELDRLHKKTSLSLFFLGIVLFSCILVGFPHLIQFMPNGEQLLSAQPIIWILGSAMLFDLATGFNGHIISLSKYYRFNIVVMLFLAITTISLNYLFLNYTQMGIVGVALATAISLTAFNITKISFNYLKFKVLPFTMQMLYLTLICLVAVGVALALPNFQQPFFNLIYKPSLILIAVFFGNYFLKIYDLSPYLNKNFIKSIFK